jgi:predicted  nucleic acid-binding Zn-ribbon protein
MQSMQKAVDTLGDQYIFDQLTHLKSPDTRALVILQAVDSDLIRNNTLLNELPLVEEGEDEQLTEARVSLDGCLANEEKLAQSRKALERRILQIENTVEDLSEQLLKVRTNISRARTLEEIDKQREQRENCLKPLEDVTREHIEAQSLTATSRKNVSYEEERLLRTRRDTMESLKGIRERIKRLIAAREALVPDTGRHYETYMELMDRTCGTAVVPMQEDLCSGCQMTIMPWLSVRVTNSEKPVQCPHCSRFLYAARSTPTNKTKSKH